MKLWKSKDVAACPQNIDAPSPPPSDAEQVRQKLAAVEQEIAQAETELRAVSLQAALSGDENAGYDAIARLNQLQGRKALLQNALQAAEQVERDRVAALHAREFAARKRSLAQKTGQLDRDAADVAKATKALHEARSRMASTASGIAALLPPTLRTPAKPWGELMAPMFLKQLGLLELWRLDQTAQKPDRLANYYSNFQDARSGAVRSISEIVGELSQNLKAEFDRCGPRSAPATAPEAKVVQEGAATPQIPAHDDDAVIDLRGTLGEAKEPVALPASEPVAEVAADAPVELRPQPPPAPMPTLRYFTEVTNDA
jgi:hypothetical protein